MKIYNPLLKLHTFLFLTFAAVALLLSRTDAQTNRGTGFTKENIGYFLDSLVTVLMPQNIIAGCGITIVNDSGIVFSKGYGFADLENQKSIDPNKTLFRTASVCKVVIASAMMVLKERGLIDLNADINNYLKKFKIDYKFGKPITAAHLLTHTPGFDDTYIGKSARTEAEAVPLGEFLQKRLPEQLLPPGEIYIYSNLGMALAAYIIEEITGKDYEQFIIENLFLPLEMNKSSFRIKKEFAEDIYKGYIYINGNQREFPFDFLNDYPAGQMLTTLNEFSNFMIMHLNKGSFKGKHIISQSLTEEMQSVQFTHHPELHTASGYGFVIREYSGMKLLNHDGGYPGILTRMIIIPELKLGLFIAVNGYNSSINSNISDAFLEKFFPVLTAYKEIIYPLEDLPAYDKDVDRFTGNYRFTRYSRNEITKIGLLIGLVGWELSIRKNDEGMLLMNDHYGNERRLIQTEPLLFKSIDDNYNIKFRQDNNGKITHLFTDGISSLEKIPALYTINVQKDVFTGITAAAAFVVLIGMFITIKNKIRKTGNKKSKLFILSEITASAFLFYLLAVGIIMQVIDPFAQLLGFPYGMPWYFYIAQLIPLLFILFTILFLLTLIKEGYKNHLSFGSAVGYTFFLFVCITIIWFMYTWNLIGFQF